MSHSSLTGSGSGSLAVRLGHIAGWVNEINSMGGGTATSNVASGAQVPTRLAQVEGDYAAGTADYADVANLYSDSSSFQSALNNFCTTLKGYAQATLLTMVNADTPMNNPTSLEEALTKLQAFFVADSATINYGTLPAVGAQTSAPGVTPTGDPVFVWSVKDSAGRNLQYVLPETLTATITDDAQDSSVTAGQEPYQIVGVVAQSDKMAWDWLTSKYGSGCSVTGNLTDPTSDCASSTASGNLTVNGSFSTFTTTNQADNWTYAVGVATTNFLNGSGTAYYTGEGSLQMKSDGATLNSVTQAFSTTSTTTVGAGGTPYTLLTSANNNTQYAVFLAVKMSNASPTNGTLTVDLIDGSGNVIADDQSTDNTFDIDLTAIGDTNWHTYSGVFRMPKVLPTSTPYKLRLHFTGTVLDSGKSVYVGAVGKQAMTQLYNGGPFAAAFRGSTDVNASGQSPDSWTFAVTATVGKLQKAFWRFFDIPDQGAQTPGIIIPAVTSGSATLADSLVA